MKNKNYKMKFLGNNSFKSNVLYSLEDFTRIIFKLSENSVKNWRHAPQGYAICFRFVAIAIYLNFFSPEEIAFAAATLSAQIVSEYEPDSIFAPENILLFFVSIDAPTLNFEYGEYDLLFAKIELLINSFISSSI